MESRLAKLETQFAARFASESGGSQDVAAAVARIGTAPTNWHQATIFFLTSKAEEDETMRNKAPLMFLGGVLMVVVQIIAAYGLVTGMLCV